LAQGFYAALNVHPLTCLPPWRPLAQGFYAALSVSRGASELALSRAYKRRALHLHPDKVRRAALQRLSNGSLTAL
jgi:hypothetical protein